MARIDGRTVRRGVRALVVVVGLLFMTDAVAGSNAAVGLGNASRQSLSVPQWLYLLTGGALVGSSGLLASVVTDRTFIRAIHAWHRTIPTARSIRVWLVRATRLFGLLALSLTIYLGFTGPQIPTVNAALAVGFVGVRAGLTMVAYLLGNPWPLVNPWRTFVESVPSGGIRSYPERFGVWPAVWGLLALVFVETVTDVARMPSTLALALCCYTLYAVVGGVVFGVDDWFRYGDPLAVAFRFYGRVGPLQRTGEGIELKLPGATLAETDTFDAADVAFAVALIWELTFSGFVTTVLGGRFLDALGVLVPRGLALFCLFVAGYALFLGAYWLAASLGRRRAETYLSVRTVGTWMAPPLLAIAAGYHLAHYFWFFVSNGPLLWGAFASPFSPPANPVQFVVPGWANGLNVAFILVGHLLAVWVAHARAYESFPSRLQAIRSQSPFIATMIGYTVVSLWLISLPSA